MRVLFLYLARLLPWLKGTILTCKRVADSFPHSIMASPGREAASAADTEATPAKATRKRLSSAVHDEAVKNMKRAKDAAAAELKTIRQQLKEDLRMRTLSRARLDSSSCQKPMPYVFMSRC